MKYALVHDTKTEATKGVKGVCPNCGSELIAKCGERKINHWSHKGTRTCDPWWEPETEWHRSWKNKFPDNWQENSLIDKKTGEKHIADIHTNQGLVIEFQHSHINPDERLSREKFYENLTWVVDGTRLKRDYPRFSKGKDSFKTVKKGMFQVDFPEEYFPSAWLDSSVPVIFDFLGNDTKPELSGIRRILYCLFPVKIGESVIIAEIQRSAFVNKIIDGEWLVRTKKFIDELIQLKRELQDQIEKQQRHRDNMNFQNFMGRKQYRERRRF